MLWYAVVLFFIRMTFAGICMCERFNWCSSQCWDCMGLYCGFGWCSVWCLLLHTFLPLSPSAQHDNGWQLFRIKMFDQESQSFFLRVERLGQSMFPPRGNFCPSHSRLLSMSAFALVSGVRTICFDSETVTAGTCWNMITPMWQSHAKPTKHIVRSKWVAFDDLTSQKRDQEKTCWDLVGLYVLLPINVSTMAMASEKVWTTIGKRVIRLKTSNSAMAPMFPMDTAWQVAQISEWCCMCPISGRHLAILW